MKDTQITKSNWDGQLPPHIAKNEQIWWEVFPRIRADLPHKLLQFLPSVPKQSPPREMIGKVVLIADMKKDLGTAVGSLLNDWDCYCQCKRGQQDVYMAGTATKPYLNFSVPFGLFAAVGLRFVAWANQDLNLSEVERDKLDQMSLIELSSSEECEVKIWDFQRGSWENGLDIAFKAAVWLSSNREEALANIWKITSK